MKGRTWAALAAAATLGTGTAVWAHADEEGGRAGHRGAHAGAHTSGQHAGGHMGGQHAAGRHAGAEHGRGASAAVYQQLFTQEEREQFRKRAQELQAQREQLRKEMRALAEQRAKEKGITLPERADRGGAGGHHDARRAAARQALALVSPEERTQFREKMRNAETPEQRLEVRKEFRALVEQRAKEKGIQLPPFPQPQGQNAAPQV